MANVLDSLSSGFQRTIAHVPAPADGAVWPAVVLLVLTMGFALWTLVMPMLTAKPVRAEAPHPTITRLV